MATPAQASMQKEESDYPVTPEAAGEERQQLTTRRDKPSTAISHITQASHASTGFKLEASPELAQEEIDPSSNFSHAIPPVARAQPIAEHERPPMSVFSQADTVESVFDDESGMFSFDRPGTGRPGSRGGNSYFANGGNSRLNTGIGISNIGGYGGRPITGVAIPEENEGDDQVVPLSQAAALAAAYKGADYVPPKTATVPFRNKKGTPVIELEGRMRSANLDEAARHSDYSGERSPSGYSNEKGDTKEKVGGEIPLDAYAHLSPEELYKIAAELDMLQPGHGGGVQLDDPEEDSPYAEVRASVSNFDDPNMPCLTFRAMFIGISFTIVGAALNTYFQLRYPAPVITTVLVEILAYPYGVFLAKIMPVTDFRTPRFMRKLGCSDEWSFNPGPFNIKEHTLIMIMANVGLNPAYSVNVPVAMERFYGRSLGAGFDILFLMSTQIIGFSIAGLVRRFLVWPAAMIWPSNLVICTLLNTFHAEEHDGSDGSLSQLKYFLIVLGGVIVWYFVPGYLFTGLSAFSWLCWALPTNVVVNNLFGVYTGLGMSTITFDWAQIAYIGSPLIVPWWALVNVFVGFVALFWIITPALYYTNMWDTAYLPVSTNTLFDRFGSPYATTSIMSQDGTLDAAAYSQYSPVYLPITVVMVYVVLMMVATAALTHTALYYGPQIYRSIKDVKASQTDIHAKLMLAYKEVPWWWYGATFAVFLAMSLAINAAFDTTLPAWGILIALVLPALYILPGGIIYATSNQNLSITLLAQVIPGFIWEGRPIANMIFKAYSTQSLSNALYWLQDLKLGHYMKIPPRVTFAVQLSATCVAAAMQVATLRLLETAVPDLCARRQAASLSCPLARSTFNASVIWGLVGPQRMFGADSPYRNMLWALFIGACLPVLSYTLTRTVKWRWLKDIDIPVMLAGASAIPAVNGINYSSWFLTGFVFQFALRRWRFRWWSRFNFVTSAALDSGTAASIILVFLILRLPNGGITLNWWGNTVATTTYDAMGYPYLIPPDQGFGRSMW